MQLERGWRSKLSDDHFYDIEPALFVLFFGFLELFRIEVYYSCTRLCLADAWPVFGRCFAGVWPLCLASIFQLLPDS